MSRYTDLRSERPVRHFLAVTVYRAVWWPVVGALLPFALIGALVDWLSWTAFPAIARFVRPAGGAAHGFALALGNAVLGYQPEADQ